MKILSARGVKVSYSDTIPLSLLPLWVGPWAKVHHGGAPLLYASKEDIPVPPGTLVFIAWDGDEARGMVTAQDVDQVNRRASIHIAFPPDFRQPRFVLTACILAGMVMGDALGIERFWTYSRYTIPAYRFAKLAGFKEEGCLAGHEWTPDGRVDVAVLGASWHDLKAANKAIVGEARWEGV